MRRNAFTLVELMVAIAIIAILAGLILAAMGVSAERAREARTQTMIRRLDQAMQGRWESYRTRRLNVPALDNDDAASEFPGPYFLVDTDDDGSGPDERTEATLLSLGFVDDATSANYMGHPRAMQQLRLLVLRETMRCELPQTWEDITTDPTMIDRPAVSVGYLRKYNALVAAGTTPTGQYSGSECLYMIVTAGGIDEDVANESAWRHEDVGDADEDGAPEFHDGWDRPIAFLRWAPGFTTDGTGSPVSDLQPDPTLPDVVTFARENHDPFDPTRADMPVAGGDPRGFRLFPLIYSAGPDGVYDLWRTASGTLTDPYTWPASPDAPTGTPMLSGQSYGSSGEIGEGGFRDNIHNHLPGIR